MQQISSRSLPIRSRRGAFPKFVCKLFACHAWLCMQYFKDLITCPGFLVNMLSDKLKNNFYFTDKVYLWVIQQPVQRSQL